MVPLLIYIYLCLEAVGNSSAKAFAKVPVSTKQANAIDDLNKRNAGEAGITDTSVTKRQKKPNSQKV